MYNRKFVSDTTSNTFLFSPDNFTVFDIEGLSGLSVDISETQGAGQIGTAVATQAVGSKYLTVTGFIYNNEPSIKRTMRKVFAPFESGKLYFNDGMYIGVVVADIPTFSPVKNNGSFSMRLLCPYPFWKKAEQSLYTIGEVTPMFRFPVRFEEGKTFRLGSRSNVRQINCINNGDMETDYELLISADGESKNPTITNVNTFEKLKFNYTLQSGEKIKLYRDTYGIIRCVKIVGENETNIMGYLDESSNLFSLHIGDNILLVSDDTNNGANILAQIAWNDVVRGVFEE